MIHLVVALPDEARPLVSRLGLEPDDLDAPFKLYRNDLWRLAVSGIGKSAAAAASAFLFARSGESRREAWLNVGVAGHASLPLGELVVADQVIEAATDRRWYPQLVFSPACHRATICTVDSVEADYGRDRVFEMEASGFFSTAVRFSTAEFVHVLKVISDNRSNPVGSLSRRQMGALIEAAAGDIEAIGLQIAALTEDPEPSGTSAGILREFEERWHFTVTGRRQLERLLERVAALDPGVSSLESLSDEMTAKAVLESLRELANGLPVRFGDSA